MTLESSTSLTKDDSFDLVTRLLAGEGWVLADSAELTAEIWRARPAVLTESQLRFEIIRRYAAVLHRCCLQGNAAEKETAWNELRVWLSKRVRSLESHPETQEELVQETLLTLQSALPKTPNAFLAYALQIMKRRQIDLNRERTAEKRGSGKTLSLEALADNAEDENGRSWQEKFSAGSANWRTIEGVVSDQEVRLQLRQFAQEHLATELQRQVFEAHFLDGLKPAEIAQLMEKQPHEIRLVKSRTVKKMKSLPPSTMQQLLTILREVESQ